MKKIFVSLAILILLIAVSGCVQIGQPGETAAPAVECDASKQCQAGYSCMKMPESEFKCVTEEYAKDPCKFYQCAGGTECLVLQSYPPQIRCMPAAQTSAPSNESGLNGIAEPGTESEKWCEPTDLNIFVDPYIPIKEVSIFVNKDYDMEFGPNKATKVFQDDSVVGYFSFVPPESMRYSGLIISGRFVSNGVAGESPSFSEGQLLKYGDYRYQYWEGAKASEGTLNFEVKLQYTVNNKEQVQCKSYSVPVSVLDKMDKTDLFDFSNAAYSRSRIFEFSGNFSEGLYDDLSRDFSAVLVTENINDPSLSVSAKLTPLNKIVCVGHSCSFKSEVNIPRNSLGYYSDYEQWCGSAFKVRFKIDRGVAQPFYADLPAGTLNPMCTKLKQGS